MNQQLIFPADTDPGSATQCFPVFAIDNSMADGDRTFSLLLTSSNPRVLSSPVQIIIEDNERKKSAMTDSVGCFQIGVTEFMGTTILPKDLKVHFLVFPFVLTCAKGYIWDQILIILCNNW